jgi:hypothetical protein
MDTLWAPSEEDKVEGEEVVDKMCHGSQMSSSRHDTDIFEEDGGVDDRVSLSSGSSYSEVAPAPSRPDQLYQTPDARSQTSSIGRHAKAKLTRLSGGRICLLTRESTPEISIEAAHLLPRATPGKMVHPYPC